MPSLVRVMSSLSLCAGSDGESSAGGSVGGSGTGVGPPGISRTRSGSLGLSALWMSISPSSSSNRSQQSHHRSISRASDGCLKPSKSTTNVRSRPFPIYLFDSYGDQHGHRHSDGHESESTLNRLKCSLSYSELAKRMVDEPSPRGNRSASSGDELDLTVDGLLDPNTLSTSKSKVGPPSPVSRAAATHKLKKLKTPSRCRECDSYVYFQAVECAEVSGVF